MNRALDWLRAELDREGGYWVAGIDSGRAQLGDQFSLREYHNVALRTGSVPLPIPEQQVDGYITATKRKA